ncbi:MAG: undecaprenyl diphosphate synthase family protein, partial [Planctomycetes bacterium]|nr:undecaprenyl diphosphate synthase family protein [Planctomycetota bacterium]
MTNVSIEAVDDKYALPDVAAERRPRHIAIIMDGNGRWARQRNLPRVAGHRAGAKSVR